MNRSQQLARIAFALGMMSVGVLALVYGYAVLVAQPLPAWFLWPKGLGYVSGIVMLATGAGLLFERTARLSTCILLPFMAIWLLSRLPVPVADPLREISWFLVGEIAVPTAAALVLFARHAELRAGSKLETITRRHAVPIARILVGLSVTTFGLSHFFEFAARTVSLVPSWLPFPTAWAELAGAAQIAAGLGVLFSIYPRWAARAEAAMLGLFTLLVWVPAVVTKPALHSNWVEFLFSGALAGATWVVAESIPARESAERALNRGAPTLDTMP
jgi:uncharacterized membrane protein